jgi:hypothetical protein
MIDLKAISSPKLLRETVREQTYPNSQVERATIAAADAAADAVVARHAALMQADATERIESGTALMAVTAELESTLAADVRDRLDEGTDPTALAATYERIEHAVRTKIAELRHEAAKAELLADRMESPEDDYERLIERLPALRRGIQW